MEFFVSIFLTDGLYQAVSEDLIKSEVPLNLGEDEIDI